MRAFLRISPISLRRSFSPGEVFRCLKKFLALNYKTLYHIQKIFSIWLEVEGSLFPYLSSTSQSLLNSFSLRWRRKGMLECFWFFFFIRSEIQVCTVNGQRVASGRRQRRRPGTLRGQVSAVSTGCFPHRVPPSSPAPLLALPSSSLPLTRRRQLAVILLPGVWGHQWTPHRNPAQPQPLDCAFLGGIPWGPGLPPWFNRTTLSSRRESEQPAACAPAPPHLAETTSNFTASRHQLSPFSTSDTEFFPTKITLWRTLGWELERELSEPRVILD